MSFIAIDVGTSFIKGCVLDLDTRRLSHLQRFPFPEPIAGRAAARREYDPATVLVVVKTLIDQLAAEAGNCAGLVMCSQMHGLVLCDPQGAPLSTLTTWQDERALQPHPRAQQSYFEVAAQRIGTDAIRQMGNEFRPGLPVARLFALAEQDLLPAEAVPLALPDFILSQLCNVPPCTDVTHAMAHGALDLQTLDWHSGALAALGLERLRWPKLLPQGGRVGVLRLGGHSVPCYAPVGDYQCAMAGAFLRSNDLSLNISTGSQVSVLAPRFVLGDFQTRPFFDGRFLATITHIPAGRALSALVRLLTELADAQGVSLADPWAYIERAAAVVAPPQMRVDLAFFASSCGDQGELTGIREAELTVGHLFRAAFQNMADNYRACAARLAPVGDWDELVFSGGLAHRFKLLREMISETFHLGYRLCPEPEDTLLGLMALAMAFTGEAGSVEQAMSELGETYQAEAVR